MNPMTPPQPLSSQQVPQRKRLWPRVAITIGVIVGGLAILGAVLSDSQEDKVRNEWNDLTTSEQSTLCQLLRTEGPSAVRDALGDDTSTDYKNAAMKILKEEC